ENSFDSAHIAYVHRATFGNMSRPQVDPNRTVVANEYGFESNSVSQVKVRGELAQTTVSTADQDTTRRTQSTWYMPFIRRAAIHYPHGLIHVLITCATPMTDGTSMILQWVYRNDTDA